MRDFAPCGVSSVLAASLLVARESSFPTPLPRPDSQMDLVFAADLRVGSHNDDIEGYTADRVFLVILCEGTCFPWKSESIATVTREAAAGRETIEERCPQERLPLKFGKPFAAREPLGSIANDVNLRKRNGRFGCSSLELACS
mmetsp:Transcript_15653/g.37524  ORF Transcript_15653/g.37524 Transcript_15653/m.37524 type:complete len:143 (-) Transcript_15653:718-1146(-)